VFAEYISSGKYKKYNQHTTLPILATTRKILLYLFRRYNSKLNTSNDSVGDQQHPTIIHLFLGIFILNMKLQPHIIYLISLLRADFTVC
jgi:hypothetical protein